MMNSENQLLEKFQVEELEKRYEFCWCRTTPTVSSASKAPDVVVPPII